MTNAIARPRQMKAENWALVLSIRKSLVNMIRTVFGTVEDL
jgi:hypothetical protein